MALDTFLVRLPLDRSGWTEGQGRELAASLAARDGTGALRGVWAGLDRDALLLTFLIEAEDHGRAEQVAAELRAAAWAALGERARELGPAGAGPPAAIGRLVLASDLDELVGLDDDGAARPPVRLRRHVRRALGLELLTRLGDPEGVGTRVRLGRVLTQHEPRPSGEVPWRRRRGPEVGLPSSTELSILSGVAFEVARDGAERLVTALAEALEGTGWSAVRLGEAVEEWFGGAGFRVGARAAPGRTLVGLFPVDDPLDLVWFHGTTAAEVGVGTDELVRFLAAWGERADLVPVQVGATGLVLRFRSLPDELLALAAESLGLCPRAHAREEQESSPLPAGRATVASFQDLAEGLARTGRLTFDWS